jgi:small subunit ribosomal protein S7e
MSSVNKKIRKAASKKLTDLEEKVDADLIAIENSPTNDDIKAVLADIFFLGATQMRLKDTGRESILLSLPYKLLTKYKMVAGRLVRDLEKKFSGQHVVVIAHRTIAPERPRTGKKVTGLRPRSRTLTAVHECLLEDLVSPGEIVGKRTRVKMDGSKTLNVLLDPKDAGNLENKFETFEVVYKKLTGKDAKFSFQTIE